MKSNLTTLARNLRKRSTDAERLMWSHLRGRRLGGFKFRRQQPIGNYIVDFVCFEKRLIVEVDGGQHTVEADKDRKRDNWFEEQDYKVLRFWNTDVLNNTYGVLKVILDSC